jgi:hypothetical protein
VEKWGALGIVAGSLNSKCLLCVEDVKVKLLPSFDGDGRGMDDGGNDEPGSSVREKSIAVEREQSRAVEIE